MDFASNYCIIILLLKQTFPHQKDLSKILPQKVTEVRIQI